MPRARICASVCAAVLAGACSSGESAEPIAETHSPLMWAQQHKFAPSDGPGFKAFGSFVALDESTALLSAHWAGSEPAQSGAVYAFVRDGSSWAEQQVLAPSDPSYGGLFGFGRAIDAETALIGAPGAGNRRGAAYAFERAAMSWSEVQKLVASDGALGDAFGEAVAIDGDLCVIGASEDTDQGITSGSAYVFERSNGSFAQKHKLLPSDGAALAAFGGAVAIEGDTVVVGAPAFSEASGLPGKAYVFTLAGGSYGEQKLEIPDPAANDWLGRAVSLDQDTLVVGAPGDPDVANVSTAGAAYVFVRTGASWQLQQKLTASDGHVGDYFGGAVAIQGDRLVVGAGYAHVKFDDQGAVYFFSRADGKWAEVQKFSSDDTGGDTFFGISLALFGSTLVVGASDPIEGSGYAFALLGASCSDGSECSSAACVDGVCCERACDGICESCNQPGQEGTCLPAPSGEPDALCAPYICAASSECRNACTSTADCAPGFACNASGQCEEPPAAESSADSGCGCRAAGAGSEHAGWALGLFAIALLSRRRLHPG